MSSTNKTATIELSQYVSTDKPTYLVDYNGDMLKIDNAIAADRDSITTAQNKANTADGKADINKTSIDNLNLQVNGDPDDPSDVGIAGDLTAVEGTVNTVTALLGNGHPTTSDQTVIGAINGLEGAIAPREDGANLANSYSQGEQFARGGSVYEALTSLTADTPFASLVLNTDYKVSDTLVEQIANAGGAVLPDGYYLKAYNQKIEVLADGVMTLQNFSKNLAENMLTAIQSLADDELIEVVSFYVVGTRYSVNPTPKIYSNTSNDFTIAGIQISYSTTGSNISILKIGVAELSSNTLSSNVKKDVDFAIGGASTAGHYESDVPASGAKASCTYHIFKKF